MPARKPLSAAAAAFLEGGEPVAATSAPPQRVTPAAAEPPEPEARVRFTVDLPRSLHKRLKLAAVDREVPMTDLARQALGEWLDSRG